jgi:hypothetical protein
LYSDAKELRTLRCLTIPELLNLKKYNVRYIDSIDGNAVYNYGNGLYFCHGNVARKHSAYSAKAMYENFNCNMGFGHTHRLGGYYKTSMNETFVCKEFGCMCDISESFIANPNWQNGLGEIRIFKDEIEMLDRRIFKGYRL